MPHMLVKQLRFARAELLRCLEGVTPEEAQRRLGQMNCISWIVGHLGNQERNLWVVPQGKAVAVELAAFGGGKPASTPPLDETLALWRESTAAADEYLETLTPAIMTQRLLRDGQPAPYDIGTALLRNILHYWFHIGEAHAIRQMMGHRDLPQFVGNMDAATYTPE
ncbi:MAG: DUF664 domain-containing protein [Chloroflexi bacterium]|nr:DUF664 domain-containing protein [Chloroflexota bacterium]